MRYLKKLADKDIALNRAMIPLGSCTMKLNAATELIPIAYRGFARIHPFVPYDQVKGYLKLIEDLSKMLCLITGFDQVSLQPNSGAQGELAGLMTIKSYLDDIGEKKRNVCLIPSSSHGTNPASAIMAGMSVVVIDCDEHGNVNTTDLQRKASQYCNNLAALMITYPSTHGVFEQEIVRICDIIHSNGGQVYMDGANLNALVGVAKPSKFGVDVCHINLHKTFCIPHGGGGPGVGPIAVKKHLSKYLPSHIYDPFKSEKNKSFGTVSSAHWGSASILPISYSYIRMMGGQGLKKATAVAILHANYIAKKLSNDYSILYTGQNNKVAHECIIDIRPIKKDIGISEEDIAKRLIDYGFHAPTMSFPVQGTLMIEPTESESKGEIDRFCEAMISIKKEILLVNENKYSLKDNPLVNAPHTATELINEDWNHCYSKKVAYFPGNTLVDNKYWPPVKRIDNVYGDRNLFCSCPAVDDYNEIVNIG
jgi:glycine dehydrogenase